MKLFALILFCISLFFLPQVAFGATIIPTPEKEQFGPNDWIRIFVKIEGYSGGEVQWSVTKPDDSVTEGKFSNLQASKTTHTINRNAFDNQFGTWKIDYVYKDQITTINVTVLPLTVSLNTDKESYGPNDFINLHFNTNYYIPTAANAELLTLEFLNDDGSTAKLIDDIKTKVSQPNIFQQYSVADILKYNSFGTYHIKATYYNVVDTTTFQLINPDSKKSIFLGTDKSLYDPGDTVEVNIVVQEITVDSGTLTITSPSGKITTKKIPINSSLTRIFLEPSIFPIIGTYQYKFEYGASVAEKTIDFLSESLDDPKNNALELSIDLEKDQYRPGETIRAQISTNKLIENPVLYWFEDPVGNLGGQFSFKSTGSGEFIIPHIVNVNSIHGPWKMHIKYGQTQTFAIFFVAGEPLSPSEQVESEQNQKKTVLLTIDNRITDFGKIADISFADNHLFVLDSVSSKIKVFDPNGKLKKIWGDVGSSDGLMKNPSAIFADNNFVHVADAGNFRLVTFDHDGNLIRIWGNSGIESQSVRFPSDISSDSSGVYYVSDSQKNKILKFDSNGDYVGQIDSILTAAAKFSSIESITSSDSSLFLLASNDNRILEYRYDGIFVKSFGTMGQNEKQLQNPSSIDIFDNDLYIADSGNYRIQVLDTDGNFVTKWGSFGNNIGQFSNISGIVIDDAGNIWVSDSGNNRIQKFAAISTSLIIPDWIRNNAKWWHEQQITDSDFAQGIEYMIKQKIIHLPNLESSDTSTEQIIPDWIKSNAGWWADGLISDQEFANGIEFLVNLGIIRV